MRDGQLFEHDVEGAPVTIGAQVVVRALVDDETFDPRFAGARGVVRGLFYDEPGRFPADPLVLVHVGGVGEDLFFTAELRPG